MPVSSKKVIEIVDTFKGATFTENSVKTRLLDNSRRKEKRLAPKDLERISETFFVLTSIGYLFYTKNKFIHNEAFNNTGEISIKRGGKGEINYGEFLIEIKDDFTHNAHTGDIVFFKIYDIRRESLYAKVTGIKQRKKEIYFAKVAKLTGTLAYYRLIDLPGEFFAVAKRDELTPKMHRLVKVELTGKQLASKSECHILETNVEDSEQFDFERVVSKHALPSAYNESNYQNMGRHFDEELKGREDFRDLLTITIDGDHAKDFDDAISFEELDSSYRLYVHIADVSAYVKKGDALDTEALSRGNSYYLGNRVIPMLPEILSNRLCSLRQDEEKLTMTAVMEYDKEKLQLLHTEYFESVIKVDKRLTYKIADELIDLDAKDAVATLVADVNSFAHKLKKIRVTNGRLDLDLTDFELQYDEKNRFTDIGIMKRLRSHELIEECMLAANEAVARTLRKKKCPALYRVHEEISQENWFKLRSFLALFKIKIKNTKNIAQALQKVIDTYRKSDYSYIVNIVILKSMMQAFYGTDPAGHFGLGFEDYTHFTSPIRRYSDLVVHRVLKSHIRGEELPYTTETLNSIGAKCSEMERVAQKAERELYKIKSCRLMERHIGEYFNAIVSGVSKGGIFVALVEKPVEGMVPFVLMGDDYYTVDEESFTVYGRRTNKSYTLGDKVEVQLAKSDHILGQIDFIFADKARKA